MSAYSLESQDCAVFLAATMISFLGLESRYERTGLHLDLSPGDPFTSPHNNISFFVTKFVGLILIFDHHYPIHLCTSDPTLHPIMSNHDMIWAPLFPPPLINQKF